MMRRQLNIAKATDIAQQMGMVDVDLEHRVRAIITAAFDIPLTDRAEMYGDDLSDEMPSHHSGDEMPLDDHLEDRLAQAASSCYAVAKLAADRDERDAATMQAHLEHRRAVQATELTGMRVTAVIDPATGGRTQL